jgi:hypothetical protein
MKTLLGCLAFVGLLAASVGSASAVSVTASTTLTGGGVSSVLKSAPAALVGTTGTLTVTASGNLANNVAVFAALDSFNIGTVRATDSFGPGVIQKTFSVSASTLASILSNGSVLFKFRSSTATVPSPYAVTGVLSYATVPEPTSMAILGLGAIGALGFRRRKLLAV